MRGKSGQHAQYQAIIKTMARTKLYTRTVLYAHADCLPTIIEMIEPGNIDQKSYHKAVSVENQ
jgi:hypothetical protein